LLPRSRLISALSAAAQSGAVLLSGAAGSGKTSLLVTWFDAIQPDAAVAWLTLRPEHNDASLLVDDLHAALVASGVVPGQPQAFALDDVVASVEARPTTRPAAIVLDDAHVITNPKIHQELALLLQRVAPNTCVVVSGREFLPGPWATMRARGALVEMRGADLAFDDAEASALLGHTFGLSLTDDQVRILNRRTEGWAAGLCLAGLALASGHAEEAGSQEHRAVQHAVEFLDAAVLADLPDDVQQFMEDTSILPILEPELCDAVTLRPGAAQVLRRLVAGNLFTEELATDAAAFRYHPLLKELLGDRLDRRDPDRRAALTDRAAHWLADRGRLREATDLLVGAGGREDVIERLIRRACGPALKQGHAATVVRWLRALPVHRLEAAPDLALVMCRASGLTGDLVSARAMLNAASRAIRTAGDPDPGHRLGEQHMRIAMAVWEGGLEGLAESLAQELPLLDAQSPTLSLLGLTKASVVAHIAAAQLFRGDLDAAARAAEEAVTPDELAPLTRHLVLALGVRALALAWSGDAARAAESVAQAVPLAAALPPTASEPILTWTAQAWVGPPDEADSACERTALAAEGTAIPLLRALPSLVAVRALTRLGRVDEARAAFAVARQVVADLPEPGYLIAVLADLDHTLKLQEVSRPDLTPLELEMVRQIAAGSSRAEVAAALHYSVNTVKYHLKSAYRKLGAANRQDAVSAAREWGLLDPVAAPPPPLPKPSPGAQDRISHADLR
jgi:LuxR family maltose regulon positive regulatory protein